MLCVFKISIFILISLFMALLLFFFDVFVISRSQDLKLYNFLVNGQFSATNTTRLNRGGMLSVKRQSHVLRHVMALRWFGTPKSYAFG